MSFLGINFCGDTCQCKNRCKAELGWNKSAQTACKNACKGDPSIDPMGWLDLQPAYVQAHYEADTRQDAILAGIDPETGEPLPETDYTWLYLVLGIALVALVYFLKR